MDVEQASRAVLFQVTERRSDWGFSRQHRDIGGNQSSTNIKRRCHFLPCHQRLPDGPLPALSQARPRVLQEAHRAGPIESIAMSEAQFRQSESLRTTPLDERNFHEFLRRIHRGLHRSPRLDRVEAPSRLVLGVAAGNVRRRIKGQSVTRMWLTGLTGALLHLTHVHPSRSRS